jgi:RES domain-containing protein
MLRAWRIVKATHAGEAFTGEGAARAGGRWNSRGIRVVYASATQSLAALEILVHLNPFVPLRFTAFPVDIPDNAVEWLSRADLPEDWRAEPPPPSTRRMGDQWLRSGRAVALGVPSVIVPDEWNFLLNPAHPDMAKVTIGAGRPFAMDPRLLTK